MCFLFFAVTAFSQQETATSYGFIRGSLVRGKWDYSPVQKVKGIIDFKPGRITVKDSSGTLKYRLLKDVVTKRMDEDSCIASLRTAYDKDNIRCMINLVEFDNGTNVLNIMYANISYSYYFRRVEDRVE